MRLLAAFAERLPEDVALIGFAGAHLGPSQPTWWKANRAAIMPKQNTGLILIPWALAN